MPAIKKPSDHFDSLIYTGDGSATTRAVTGLNFQPDFVWIKDRTAADDHCLQDVIRGFGTGKAIRSNTTDAETDAGGTYYGYISSVNSTGFVVGKGTDDVNGNRWVNFNTYLYVAWNWKAGGTAVSNTSGTITSSVSANPTAGFSVVTYTGTGSAATVGHGLSVAPQMIIVLERTPGGDDHIVYHNSLTSNSHSIRLNTTAGQAGPSGAYWNSTSPTSSVFSVGNSGESNQSTATYVAYCFAPIAGYSAFGKYTGNGSADGPFVYTGFRPRFVMVKNTTNSAGVTNWVMQDSSRNGFNPNKTLYANASSVEDAAAYFDILSNGFKVRDTFRDVNTSSDTYIYAAFAEAPQKYANAR